MGEALEAANSCSDLAALVDMYSVKLSEVLDNHTPKRPKQSRFHIINPGSITSLKNKFVLRRKKEKTFGPDPTDYNYQAFYYQYRYDSNMTKHAKKQYYMESIKNCDRDAKSLFNLAINCYSRKNHPLPKCDDNKILCR